MKSYSLVNLKGGSGKTTSAVSLAATLALEGQSILLVDLDPQGSATRWLGRARQHAGTPRLLAGEAPPADVVEVTDYEGLDIVTADRSLARLEETRPARLARYLEGLMEAAQKAGYAYVLLDPPPSVGSLVVASLLTTDGILAPVAASDGAVDALLDTLRLTRDVGGAPLRAAFACRVTRTVNDQQVPELLRDELGERAAAAFVRETVRVREAETAHVPLPIYAPEAAATLDYAQLAREIFGP